MGGRLRATGSGQRADGKEESEISGQWSGAGSKKTPCYGLLPLLPLPPCSPYCLLPIPYSPSLPLSGKYTTTWAGLIGSSTGLSVHPAWLLSQKMIAVVLPSRQRS